MRRTIGLDTESYYDDMVSVKPLGSFLYARHPLCDVYNISVYDGEEKWTGHPRDFNFDSLHGQHIVCHNLAHDYEIVTAKAEQGLFPEIRDATWDCTANLSSYLCGRRALSQAVEKLFGHKLSKQVRNDAKGKTWDDMLRDGSAAEMLKYAGDDAVWCWKLWDKFSPQWPAHERELSNMTIEQGRHGVRIDVGLLNDGINIMQGVIMRATDMLPWVRRGKAPASPIGIAEECRAAGIPCPPVKAHDPEAAEEWVEQYASQLPWVQALKDLRRAKKMLATLETIKLRLRPDDTMPFSLLYFGAHTGRWAGTGGLNMQNLNKDSLFGFTIRDLFIARPGKKFVIADLSQIEPRCLNWVIGNEPLLERIRAGEPIYEAHARLAMGWTGGRLKKENPKLYALAKAQVLALGYGAGWEKFITMALSPAYGNMDLCAEDEQVALANSVDRKIYVDEETKEKYFLVPERIGPGEEVIGMREPVYGANARRIVQGFRNANPLIKGLWDSLQQNLIDSVGGDMLLTLPSGRELRYEGVTRKKKRMLDKKTGEVRERWVLEAAVEGFQTKLYGGILTENLIQATARDVFCDGLLRLRAAGHTPLWTVHDEAIVEVDENVPVSDITRLMTVAPDWMPGLPVEAEAVESRKYLK